MNTVASVSRRLARFIVAASIVLAATDLAGQSGPDAFEFDDGPAFAKLLSPGVPQFRTFHFNGDVDWAFFGVTAGTQFTLTTTDLGVGVDTVMYLVAEDGTTIITSDDDGGGGKSSRIVHTASFTTTLFVAVVQFNPSSTGPYTLNLAGGGGGGPADIRIPQTTLNFTPANNKQIFVELDWMEDGSHSHRPSAQVINAIVATFAREGFTITIDVSNAIPHQNVLPLVSAGPSASASVQTLKAQFFNNQADPRYFYSIWGHNYSTDGQVTGSSGYADLPGNTHVVTLGSFDGEVGNTSEQIGTFVHEFGHNIGQRHGGTDHDNFKPNYLSVMNYHYQMTGLGPGLLAKQYANTATGFNHFGYSHGLLPSLNESNLNEAVGIGLGRGIDWNCDGNIGGIVARDIQAENHCNANGGFTTLSDFDNWGSINSFIQADVMPMPFTFGPSVICITPEESQAMRDAVEALRAQDRLPSEAEMLDEIQNNPAAGAGGKYFEVINDGGSTLNVTGITLDTPAVWLTFEPQSFSVAPGGTQRVQVYVNFATKPAGESGRRLLVASNDPDESPYPNAVFVSTLPTTNVVQNGGFASGTTGWSTFALPDPSGMTFNTNGGVFQFNRTGTQAVVFQNTGLSLPTQTAVETTFQLGNSDSVRKRVSVLVHDSDFSDLSVCTFWLPPTGQTLHNYTIRTHTTKTWANATVSFYAATAGNGGFYRLDNVSFVYQPAGATTATTCIDPFATSGGTSSATNLISNGNFSGGMTSWALFGQINGSVNAGVFEFIRLPGNPAGVILQETGQAITAGQVLTATFRLGNSSGIRKRVTVLLHNNTFTDLSACTFWLAPGQPLSTYTYRTYATAAWTNATFSVYGATVGAEQYTRLDDVTLQRTGGAALSGTHCIEPGGAVPDVAAPAPRTPDRAADATDADASAERLADAPVSESPTASFQTDDEWIGDGFVRDGLGWITTGDGQGPRTLTRVVPLAITTTGSARLTLLSWLSPTSATGEIQVSTNGIDWETIRVVAASDGWVPLDIDLSGYAGERLAVRFVLEASTAVSSDASDVWRIDEVRID